MNESLAFTLGLALGLFLMGMGIGMVDSQNTCQHKFGDRTQEYAICRYQEKYGAKP